MGKYRLGGVCFGSKAEIKRCVQGIFSRHRDGDYLGGMDLAVARGLLDLHPRSEEKKGCGVVGIKTVCHVKGTRSLGFSVVRVDGSEVDFSYKVCLSSSEMSVSRAQVIEAFRFAVLDQVIDFKKNAFRETDAVWSEPDRRFLKWNECHVDHYPVSFSSILGNFLEVNKVNLESVKLVCTGIKKQIADLQLRTKWQSYHKGVARYQIISPELNIKLGNRSVTSKKIESVD